MERITGSGEPVVRFGRFAPPYTYKYANKTPKTILHFNFLNLNRNAPSFIVKFAKLRQLSESLNNTSFSPPPICFSHYLCTCVIL